jgi:hypothetical protein
MHRAARTSASADAVTCRRARHASLRKCPQAVCGEQDQTGNESIQLPCRPGRSSWAGDTAHCEPAGDLEAARAGLGLRLRLLRGLRLRLLDGLPLRGLRLRLLAGEAERAGDLRTRTAVGYNCMLALHHTSVSTSSAAYQPSWPASLAQHSKCTKGMRAGDTPGWGASRAAAAAAAAAVASPALAPGRGVAAAPTSRTAPAPAAGAAPASAARAAARAAAGRAATPAGAIATAAIATAAAVATTAAVAATATIATAATVAAAAIATAASVATSAAVATSAPTRTALAGLAPSPHGKLCSNFAAAQQGAVKAVLCILGISPVVVLHKKGH